MKKLDDLAIDFWREAQGTSMFPNNEGQKQINQFKSLIAQELKKITKSLQKDIGKYTPYSSYNLALSDVDTKIEEFCGGQNE